MHWLLRRRNTINRKKTHMNIWNEMDILQFQHRNPPALSIQDSPIYSERTSVHKQPQDPRKSTNEHSAQWNKEWSTKYLRKLENHVNALAVNLLDNNETTHELKRHTVLTLPDRPE
jgi:hypothetical protein